MTITDPMRARPIAPSEVLPGLRVMVRQQQWLATVVALDGNDVWLQFDADLQRNFRLKKRVPLSRLCRLADVRRDCFTTGACQGHCTGPLYCDPPPEELS